MPLNPDNPAAIVACADYTLPAGLGVTDCFNPTLLYGPGTELFMSLSPFAAVPALTEYTAKRAVVATDKLYITPPIVCQLSLSAGSEQSDRINGLDYPKPTDLSLAVTLQNLDDANYDLMRRTQRGGLRAYFWFQDRNNKFYGGQNGIFGGRAILALRLNLPTDESALQTITGTIKARGFFDPARMEAFIPLV